VGLHLLAGWREWQREGQSAPAADDAHWVDAGEVDSIPEKRARVLTLADEERVAIFRYDGKLAAVFNVCAHQNGPLDPHLSAEAGGAAHPAGSTGAGAGHRGGTANHSRPP